MVAFLCLDIAHYSSKHLWSCSGTMYFIYSKLTYKLKGVTSKVPVYFFNANLAKNLQIFLKSLEDFGSVFSLVQCCRLTLFQKLKWAGFSFLLYAFKDTADNYELFLRNSWPTKSIIKFHFQLEPLSEILPIANLRHAVSSIWNCAEHNFRLCIMKVCSSDNHNIKSTLSSPISICPKR